MKNYQLTDFFSPEKIDYEANLNPEQLAAVKASDGPALVLAGAGSGKTRVLTYRLAYLLEKNVPAPNILIATFTNKAAREMIHRAESLMKSRLTGLWAGTFHHIANLILRREAAILGYTPNFTILDEDDSCDMIQDSIEELGYSKREKTFPKKNVINAIKSLCVNCRDNVENIIFKQYRHIDEFTPAIKNIILHYHKKKKAANVMDFDDLLSNWLLLLDNPALREKYSETFRYILVDEYQDTNALQFAVLKQLATHHNNIMVVGDDAQSIYSFRGAEIKNLLSFPEIFKNTQIHRLETNYRSSPQILNIANDIIRHNLNQFPKNLHAVKKNGALPVAVRTLDVYQQAKFLAQHITTLNEEGIALKDIAVLFRSRFQAMEAEMELVKRGLPYVIRGGVRFFEQTHIKDVTAYLRICANPNDELSFKRALCLHKGIGRGYALKIWEQLNIKKDFVEGVMHSLPKRPAEGFKEFCELWGKVKTITNPEEAISTVLKFYNDYCYLNFDNADDRVADLEELSKMAQSYKSIEQFVADISLLDEFKGETRLDESQKDEALVLSTIHQAKGLEWDTVFLIGFNEFEFPHPKSLASAASVEEERRLFYVAATRAKRNLFITYPQNKYTNNGMIIARASKFLQELNPDCYEEWGIEN